MSRIFAALILATLTGCASINEFTERHPRATALIAGSIVVSIALSTRGERHDAVHTPDVATPAVSCADARSCQ